MAKYTGPHVVLMTPDEVRAAVDSISEGRTAQEVADKLGCSRRVLFYYLKHGVVARITPTAKLLMDADKAK